MKKLSFLLLAMICTIVAQAWTVSFTNPDNWTKVSVWAWQSDGTNCTGGTWPGATMTKSGDVWTYEGTGNPAKIIFNNGGGGKQTGDLDFVDGATYNMSGPVGAALNTYKMGFSNTKNWNKVYV